MASHLQVWYFTRGSEFAADDDKIGSKIMGFTALMYIITAAAGLVDCWKGFLNIQLTGKLAPCKAEAL